MLRSSDTAAASDWYRVPLHGRRHLGVTSAIAAWAASRCPAACTRPLRFAEHQPRHETSSITTTSTCGIRTGVGACNETDAGGKTPYADIAAITDPETLDYLEDARLHGTPRPESQVIRANVPAVIHAFSQLGLEAPAVGIGSASRWQLILICSVMAPPRRQPTEKARVERPLKAP